MVNKIPYAMLHCRRCQYEQNCFFTLDTKQRTASSRLDHRKETNVVLTASPSHEDPTSTATTNI
jgi:hypothetical protein